MPPISIAVIGIGKITQDQHLPVIAKDPRFRLAALVSQRGVAQAGVPTFKTVTELLAAQPDLDAVAICTPPGARHAIAIEALRAGKHLLLEKPTAATTAEVADIAARAEKSGRTVFATWHSQYNPGVEKAREILRYVRLRALTVTWREDVRRWHPGQDWIWAPGGFGVFDPGINALSILTHILPEPIFVASAELETPANRETPIAARLVFATADGKQDGLTADFDWRQTGPQTWTIAIEGDAATGQRMSLTLSDGGSKLAVDGKPMLAEAMTEYERLYDRFATLIAEGKSEIDAAPMRLVADAYLVGKRIETAAFAW